MFKRIYLFLLTSTLVAVNPVFATPSSATNIKKVIKKDGKVIVIVRENGEDKEIVLDNSEINKILNKDNKKEITKKEPTDKKVVKSEDKVEKTTKAVTQKSKKDTKISKSKSSKNKSLAKSKNKSKEVAKSKVKSHKTTKNITKTNKKSKIKIAKVKKSLPSNIKTKNYSVKNGDTVFSIARKFKVSISKLQALNSFGNSYLIHPGDSVKIPSENFIEIAKKAVKSNKKSVYRVKKGDTLSLIAKNFNMSTAKLQAINNFRRNPRLKPGMEINIIAKASVIKQRFQRTRYQVQSGDTLWSIAKRFNLTSAELRLLNPKIRRRGLQKGTILKVSKREALRLIKLREDRKRRLSGLLSKYRRRGSSGNVVAYAKRFLGVRYRWGATGRGGFDCSGFTQYVMRHAKGRNIPRVSRRQAYYGKYVSRRNLRPGDLIFFDTSHRRRGYVNHVGIYIGNGRFIHASSGKHRVVITSLNKPFYKQRFMWGRRIN